VHEEPRVRPESWRTFRILLLTAALLIFFGFVIAYKYTGDFTGMATFGTSGRVSPKN
jgi:hypothetical protein